MTHVAFFLSMFVSMSSAVVHESVHRALEFETETSVLVSFPTGTAPALAKIKTLQFDSKETQVKEVVSNLKEHSIESQDAIVHLLSRAGQYDFESFYISNQLWIKNLDSNLAFELDKIDGITVRHDIHTVIDDSIDISPENLAVVEPGAEQPFQFQNSRRLRALRQNDFDLLAAQALSQGSIPWGVEEVKATQAWKRYGTKGQNVVVGSIDTGVMGEHVEVRERQRSTHSWYDPYDQEPRAVDENGHGTHTLATIVGKTVGIAPEAQWIACRGCKGNGCRHSALLKCAQFMLCPTDPSGKNADCQRAPDIVNNSWGRERFPGYQADLEAIIQAWHAAGIIPVFAAGNDAGDLTCGSVDFPADISNVIAVGATDSDNNIARFSSRGSPGNGNGVIKPNFAAPGVSILSAGITGNDAYAQSSGTSMAAPHVVGVATLLLSYHITFSFDDIQKILQKSTMKDDLIRPSSGCDSGSGDMSFPNQVFGYGQVNAMTALEIAKDTKPSGRARQNPIDPPIVIEDPVDSAPKEDEKMTDNDCNFKSTFLFVGHCEPELQCHWKWGCKVRNEFK